MAILEVALVDTLAHPRAAGHPPLGQIDELRVGLVPGDEFAVIGIGVVGFEHLEDTAGAQATEQLLTAVM